MNIKIVNFLNIFIKKIISKFEKIESFVKKFDLLLIYNFLYSNTKYLLEILKNLIQ